MISYNKYDQISKIGMEEKNAFKMEDHTLEKAKLAFMYWIF